MILILFFFFFFKQKTAYEMRISDWSSDVCSSDLFGPAGAWPLWQLRVLTFYAFTGVGWVCYFWAFTWLHRRRSEEHTSELQSLMRISYAVFCLKKKTKQKHLILNKHNT